MPADERGQDLAARLARAEDRLAFFASFDRVIQDNVSQAGQLMREALELRERTQADLAEARVQAEARVAAERERYWGDLAAVHAELLTLQATTAAMARRVAATLGALAAADPGFGGSVAGALPVASRPEAWPVTTAVAPGEIEGSPDVPVGNGVEPAQSDAATEARASDGDGMVGAVSSIGAASPSDSETPATGEAGTDEPVIAGVMDSAAVGDADEAEAAGAAIAAGVEEDAGSDDDGAARDVESDATDAVSAEMSALGTGEAAAAAPGDAGVAAEQQPTSDGVGAETPEEGGPRNGIAPFPAGDDAVAAAGRGDGDALVAPVAGVGPAAARAVMVLVHGVPRAAAALSLQRHLHGLRQVESVEAREYAEGVLRLQVMTDETLGLDDLRAWDGGGGLEPVTVTADVIEVRLPGAHGL